MSCPYCDEPYHDDLVELSDGEIVHLECALNNGYRKCENCDIYYPESQMAPIQDWLECPSCFCNSTSTTEGD